MAARKSPVQVWVSVEVLRGTQVNNYLGRMPAADYKAILAGSYALPFVMLEDVHWVKDVANEQGQMTAVVQIHGRPGRWEWFSGSLHLRPETITSIAPLKEGYGEFFARQNTTGG